MKKNNNLIYKDISKKIIPDNVLQREIEKLLKATYNEAEN